MEDPNQKSLWDICQILFNTVNHIMIGFISIYTILFCVNLGLDNETVLHVLLSTLGYQLLMAEAIITLYPFNTWSNFTKKKTKTTLHVVLQVAGSILAIAGNVVIYCAKDQNHFVSMHALLGLISFVFLLISLCNGILALYATNLRTFIKPVYNKFFHNIISLLAFIIGMVSLIYGYDTRFFLRQEPVETTRTGIQVMCGLTIVFTCWGAVMTMYSQVKSIFS